MTPGRKNLRKDHVEEKEKRRANIDAMPMQKIKDIKQEKTANYPSPKKEDTKRTTRSQKTKTNVGDTKSLKTGKKETMKVTKKKIEEKRVQKVEPPKKINELPPYVRYVAEAIAALESEENKLISQLKINEYIYKYIEEVKRPELAKANISKTIQKLIDERFLISKRRSYRFSSEGRKNICPEVIPKRKLIREIIVKEKIVEDTSKSVFVTSKGRISTKRY